MTHHSERPSWLFCKCMLAVHHLVRGGAASLGIKEKQRIGARWYGLAVAVRLEWSTIAALRVVLQVVRMLAVYNTGASSHVNV